MEICPFCGNQVRGLGAICLITPDQLSNRDTHDPITGGACVDCLGLLAMILDGLRGGKIRTLVERLSASGAITRN